MESSSDIRIYIHMFPFAYVYMFVNIYQYLEYMTTFYKYDSAISKLHIYAWQQQWYIHGAKEKLVNNYE